MNQPINFQSKLNRFSEHWSPKVIAEMNDYQFKLVKIKGEFTWHNHTHTDETFIVLEGSMGIEFRDRTVQLSEGEMIVVPRGEVKKVGKELLGRIKELLVLNWRKKSAARSRLRLEIEDTLDAGLPESYTPEIYHQKCTTLFEHIYESYPERNLGIYAEVA